MFCRNCANQLDDKAVACTKCGVNPRNGANFCQNCGKPTANNAVVCVSCGVQLARACGCGVKIPGAEKKLVAGIFGIVLGGFGVHKFILGYNTSGVIMLLVSVLTCGAAYVPMHIIGIIEGIIYLTRTDEEFVDTYIHSRKEWF